jgi:hypothetical protein
MRQQQRRQFKRPRTGYLSQTEVDLWHTTLSAIEERRVQPNPVTPQERHVHGCASSLDTDGS